MPQVTPDWFRIVNEYGWEVGPTLPFILGAIRKPRGEAPGSRAVGQKEFHALLTRIDQETHAGYGVNIQWCEEPGTYVVAPQTGSLCLTWANTIQAHNVDTLAAALWTLYGDWISESKYSKNGDWHVFTEIELKRIRDVLDADLLPRQTHDGEDSSINSR